MATSEQKADAILNRLKHINGKLIWKFEDGTERDADPKELSRNQFGKFVSQGRVCNRPGRPTFLSEKQSAARQASIILKIMRQSMKDVLSTNAYHDQNIDKLLHSMELNGNPDQDEIDLVMRSAAALKIYGRNQMKLLNEILNEAETVLQTTMDAQEIKEAVAHEYKLLKKRYEKKKMEAKKNVDKRTTRSPRTAEAGRGDKAGEREKKT